MAVRTFVERLLKRQNDRLSTSPVAGIEPEQRPDRVRKVRGKVELEGRVVADGIADLSVSEDRSWSATWTSPEPGQDWIYGEDTRKSPPTCEVRFEGISPTLTGVLSGQVSSNGANLGLEVVGQSWPASDFE